MWSQCQFTGVRTLVCAGHSVPLWENVMLKKLIVPYVALMIGLFLGSVFTTLQYRSALSSFEQVNTHLHSEINEIMDEYAREVDFWFKATLACEEANPSTYYLPQVLQPDNIKPLSM